MIGATFMKLGRAPAIRWMIFAVVIDETPIEQSAILPERRGCTGVQVLSDTYSVPEKFQSAPWELLLT